MRSMRRARFRGCAAIAVLACLCPLDARAQGEEVGRLYAPAPDGHVHRGTGPHGGVQALAGEMEAEVVFHAEAVEVYLRDAEHRHVEARGLSGVVSLSFDDPARPGAEAALAYEEGAAEAHVHHDAGEHCHEAVRHGRLVGRLDLARVGEGEVTAEVRFRGLPADPGMATDFSVPFRIARRLGHGCESCGTLAEAAGTCGRCGEALSECWTYFACPLHPEVGSESESDTCWKCGDLGLFRMRDEEEDEGEEPGGHEHHDHK